MRCFLDKIRDFSSTKHPTEQPSTGQVGTGKCFGALRRRRHVPSPAVSTDTARDCGQAAVVAVRVGAMTHSTQGRQLPVTRWSQRTTECGERGDPCESAEVGVH